MTLCVICQEANGVYAMLSMRAIMVYPAIFITELVVLFFLSRWMIQSLSLICYRMFRNEQAVIYILAFLFLPGTILHELAHLLTAALLFVPVGKLELFPYRTEDGVRLGSVQIGKTDPFRRAFVGLAPLFFGMACLFLTLYFFGNLPLAPWYLNIICIVLIVFEIGNTMFSSKKDVEGLPVLLLTLTILFLAFYFMGLRIPLSFWEFFNKAVVVDFFKQLVFYMLIPVGINSVVILLSVAVGKSE